MARLTHKATDELSAEAQRVMVAGFRAKLTYAEIGRQLREIGQEVAERTIGRRGMEWRTAEARRQTAVEQMQALIAALKAEEMNAAEIVHALGVQALLEDPEEWKARDPLYAEELRIKRETLELRKRQVELGERKLTMLEEQRNRAVEAAEALGQKAARGETLTAADVDRIRAVYGLREQAAA